MSSASATVISLLPALPTVSALDMLHAQAWVPTAEEREAMVANADYLEAHGLSRRVCIRVLDIDTDVQIGRLEVTL